MSHHKAEEENNSAASNIAVAMERTELKKKSSRLRILSSYLPNVFTGSKSLEDPRSSILRKPAPPGQAEPYTPNGYPTRRPPSPPPSARSISANPRSSNRLQRPEAAAQHQPAPRASSSGAPAPQSHATEYGRRPVSGSMAPPSAYTGVNTGRAVSSPMTNQQEVSPAGDVSPSGNTEKRRSWLGGGRKSRNVSQDLSNMGGSNAWVNTATGPQDYSLNLLVNGERVPEMWDYTDKADCYIYLFPPASQRGPSFRVPSYVLSASRQLASKINVGRPRARSFDGRGSLSVEDAVRDMSLRDSPPLVKDNPMDTPTVSDGSGESIQSFGDGMPREIHLYFPLNLTATTNSKELNPQDIQALVEARNLFAFLTGQPLVSTPSYPSRFLILLSIASLLWKFEFSNIDGSSYGEEVATSFGFFISELKLADVRDSREKTIEALILGERMRSADLYREAFAHAVGKYDGIKDVNPDLFAKVNPATRQKLERAFLDLTQRRESINRHLINFEFPSIFAGIASSTSSAESKFVNFKAWKSNFLSMRKMVLGYYKHLHGQWPPKARSKKNQFVEGGLNRLVLSLLYNDLCSLYDLLADRDNITTRSYDSSSDGDENDIDLNATALRKLLGEYDRSSPPVQPPIPFDLPRIPHIATVDPGVKTMSPVDQNKHATRKLKEHELRMIIAKSHNFDVSTQTSFLDAFTHFEEKEAKGKNCQELADQRYGHWIFLYGVIQSLPMLVIDAPGVNFSAGVEYFLCQPPMGGLPWVADIKRGVYQVGDSDQVVTLPSDTVEYGIEATYNRSHCWVAARKWIAGSEATTLPYSHTPEFARKEQPQALSPLAPPPSFGFGDEEPGLRSSSRKLQRSAETTPSLSSSTIADDERSRSRARKRQSIAVGLNRLPMPPSIPGGAAQENWSPSFTPVSGGGSSRDTSPSGNLSAGGYGSAGGGRRMSSRPEMSFDDILKNMDHENDRKKK